jgi:predicted transposase YbfD/YdcC
MIAQAAQSPSTNAWSWHQTGHGHDSRCRLKAWPADDAMKAQWPGLEQFVSVRRQGERDGKPFDTTTYYITSESISAWRLAQAIRGHRKIENTLHWTKDVVMGEDDCGLVCSQAAANRALMRNISFNLLVLVGHRSISEGISAMGQKISTLWQIIQQPCRKVVTA